MRIRSYLRLLSACVLILIARKNALCSEPCLAVHVVSPLVVIDLHCGKKVLWELHPAGGDSYRFAPPVFPLREGMVTAGLRDIHEDASTQVGNGIIQYAIHGRLEANPDLVLQILICMNRESPIVRFRYVLEAAGPGGRDAFGRGPLNYFDVKFPGLTRAREVQLSQFQGLTHSYNLQENDFTAAEIVRYKSVMGPILGVTDERHSLVLAYEHGSTVPETFLKYSVVNSQLQLNAVKGNVYPGLTVDAQHPWESVWMDAGAISGSLDGLAPYSVGLFCMV